jgi:hypothetical protein
VISDLLHALAAVWESVTWLPHFVTESPFGVDMTIESMKSKKFSVFIFYFLIIGILVFIAIIAMFMFKHRVQRFKTGEKWMFAWILLGVVGAVIFGATQLLHGFLF